MQLDLDLCGKVYPRLMADDALRIGEVAARSGVTRKALRLYEARGIVPKPRRTAAGYRVYPPDVLGVLHFVTQARRLGLTLKEIGSSARRGVVCQHIEGGKLPWTRSRSARPARPARKSSWRAIPSGLGRRATSSPSRRRNGTSSST